MGFIPGNKDKLLDTFFDTDDLDIIANAVADMLGNPITVLETTLYVAAFSNADDVADDYWQRGIARRCCPYEYITRIRDANISNDLGQYIIFDDIDVYRRKLFKLVSRGTCIGYFNVLESRTQYESIPEELYILAQKVLSKSLANRLSDPKQLPNAPDDHRLLYNLLHASYSNRVLFQEFLEGTGLSNSSAVYSVVAIDANNWCMDFSLEERLRGALHTAVPKAWSIMESPNIIMLAELPQNVEYYYAQLEALKTALCNFHLQAGMSDPLRDLYDFRSYYQQATKALQFAAIVEDKRPLVRYDQYKFFEILSSLPQNWTPNTYCSNTVWTMHEYDLEKGTEYLKTLYYYLDSGRSVTAAAKAMFLHRNTITYRIERVRRLFSVDFNDVEENYRLYQSCLILRYRGILTV